MVNKLILQCVSKRMISLLRVDLSSHARHRKQTIQATWIVERGILFKQQQSLCLDWRVYRHREFMMKPYELEHENSRNLMVTRVIHIRLLLRNPPSSLGVNVGFVYIYTKLNTRNDQSMDNPW